MNLFENAKKEIQERPLGALGRILIAFFFIYIVVVMYWPPGWSSAVEYQSCKMLVERVILPCSAAGGWARVRAANNWTFVFSDCEKPFAGGFSGGRWNNSFFAQ